MSLNGVVEIAAAILASLGSAGAIVIGCATWLGKVWANRILESDRLKYTEELERLRSDLGKTVHVHRIQFETEFKVLSDIWGKLSILRSAMGSLRPTMDIVNEAEASEDRLNRRLRRYDEALRVFIEAVDGQSPFYPEDIFQELSIAIQIGNRESISVAVGKPERSSDWYKEGRHNFQAFKESADKISALMRKRFATLQVQP